MEIVEFLQKAIDDWQLRENDVVLANGSRTEGLGTPESDVDCWVVHVDEEGPKRVPLHQWRDGFRINPAVYSFQTMIALSDRINAVNPDDEREIAELTLNSLDRYYRAANAVTVKNEQGAGAIRALFDAALINRTIASWARVQSLKAMRYAEMLAGSNETTAAVLQARTALNYAIDSHLATKGEAYTGFKFRLEKLGRLYGPSSEIVIRAWNLQLIPTEPQEYFASVKAFCKQMDVEHSEAKAYAVARTPQGAMFPLNGQHYVLYGASFIYHLNEEAAYVWKQLEEQASDDTIIEAYATRFGEGLGASRRKVLRFLGDLTMRDLVTAPNER